MKSIPIQDYLFKAKDSLRASEILLQANLLDISASRSYYAMFYLVSAIMLTKNFEYSSHNALISAFAREFINKGLIPSKYHNFISKAFQFRQ
jgi:uncharacterized protein (UPF0332 family)